MNVDEAKVVVAAHGLRRQEPGCKYKPGDRITSLVGMKQATVMSMHGANVVAEADDGEQLVLAYYEIGV